MSKHTTLDQLKMLAQRTNTEIKAVDAKVTTLSGRVDTLVAEGGEPNVITAVKNNGAPLELPTKPWTSALPLPLPWPPPTI